MENTIILNSGQKIEVLFQDEVSLDIDCSLRYIKSGQKEIDNYVENTVKPKLDNVIVQAETDMAKQIAKGIEDASGAAAESAAETIATSITAAETEIDAYVAENITPDLNETLAAAAGHALAADNSATAAAASASAAEASAAEAAATVNGFDTHASEKQAVFDANAAAQISVFNENAAAKQVMVDASATSAASSADAASQSASAAATSEANAGQLVSGFGNMAQTAKTEISELAAAERTSIEDTASSYGTSAVTGINTARDNALSAIEAAGEAIAAYQQPIVQIAATSGTIALETTKIYQMEITGDVTFSLPATVNTAYFNQIKVMAKITGTPAITWGTQQFFSKATPEIEAGDYDFYFDWDNALTAWVAGALAKGVAE